MNEQEGKAAIRILGAVARADKKIDEREKAALKQALIDFQSTLPDGTTIESLLSENIDLDAQLAVVKTPVARRAVFEAVCIVRRARARSSVENSDDRGVIGGDRARGLSLLPIVAIDVHVLHAARDDGRGKEEVDAHPFLLVERARAVIPPGEPRFVWIA